ncbi:MAG: MOSC domain-containing protein [Minwuia sp.]|uniref:MOSC domain-containing protein n=1 Tax=Minwuia sp. TaxID=2493630 RepID=UPI003A8A9628
MAKIEQLWTWPVKGLNGVSLERAELSAGGCMPDDRAFGIARGSAMAADRDLADFGWKDFVQLKNTPKLATLVAEYEPDGQVLTLKRQGRQVARGALSQPIGRTLIDQFLAAYLKDELNTPPKVVGGDGQTFSDARAPELSIINLETLRDIERVARTTVDPRRMRGNVYIDGLPAWAEFDLIGQTVKAGGTTLEITMRIDRCAATHVNPDSAESDLQLTRVLKGGFGHLDCGVFAVVRQGGAIAVGDSFG